MESVRSPLEIRDRRVRQLVGRRDFDPGLYEEACSSLAAQEARCESVDDLLRLRHGWFRDAFFPKEKETNLERETLIPPYPFPSAPDHLMFFDPDGGIFSTSRQERLTVSDRLNGALYGDRIFTSLKSGIIAAIPRRYTDLLGTGELDCCTALAGIREDGTLVLGHIPGPGWFSVKETLDQLETYRLDQACLIYPKLPTDGYHDASAQASALRSNAGFEDLAKAYGLPMIGFESSSTPGDRTPHTSGLRTLVTIDQDGLCVSTNQERVSGRYIHGVDHSMRLHYTPIRTKAVPWT